MSVTIYGIKTCDTMKKAFAWLDGHGVAYRFHDYRVEGLDAATLEVWAKALALMLANPTMIKRPVLDADGRFSVGFRPDAYAATFASA